MNKEQIIEKLIESADILDAQGLHRESDAIYEQIRVANQADAWGNFLGGVGEAVQWINPLTMPGKVKELIDPAFKGLHDNTGRYQADLNQFYTDLQNANIDNMFKTQLLEVMGQALSSARKMNADYFDANFGGTPASVQNQQQQQQATPVRQRSREELLKALSSSNNKFKRIVEAQEMPPADDAISLYKKLDAIQKKWVGYIQTNTPGYKETVSIVNQVLSALKGLAFNQKLKQQNQSNVNIDFAATQAASQDPQVQQAVRAYLRYGVKYGYDKMMQALEANAGGQDISVFRILVKSGWTPEMQNVAPKPQQYVQKPNPAQAAPSPTQTFEGAKAQSYPNNPGNRQI